MGGTSGPTRRSDHFAPAGDVWSRQTDQTCQSDHGGCHRHARKSFTDRYGSGQREQLPERISLSAEQWTQAGRWRIILGAAFSAFLHGKVVGSTPRFATRLIPARRRDQSRRGTHLCVRQLFLDVFFHSRGIYLGSVYITGGVYCYSFCLAGDEGFHNPILCAANSYPFIGCVKNIIFVDV
jgi:hypothetical protein